MEWEELLRALVLLAGGTVGVIASAIAFRLFKTNPADYERNRERTPHFSDALLGTARITKDAVQDHRVRAGLIYNRRSKKWVPQGILSEEALDNVLEANHR